jgi:hypothetical protein
VRDTIARNIGEGVNVNLVLPCEMRRTNMQTGEVIEEVIYHISLTETILRTEEIEGNINEMYHRILEEIATFQRRGSGWVFVRVVRLYIIDKYVPGLA